MFRIMKGLTVGSALCGLALLAQLATTLPVVQATNNSGVVPRNKKTAGKSYTQWSNSWWQWVDSIPASVSPLPDGTGANCAQNQSGPVWYLAGSSDGVSHVRTCTVPAGKSIFFPLANGQEDEREAAIDLAFFASADCPGVFGSTVCATLHNKLDPINTNHMRQLVDYIYTEVFDLLADPSTTGLFAKIDGSSVADVGSYRFDSGGGGYTITLPATGTDNYHTVFGYSIPGPDTYQGAQVGYYLMLEPLSAGAHDVEFGRPGWVITYHLTVQ